MNKLLFFTTAAGLAIALLTTARAQTEYPPETNAIPIPKMEDLPLLPGPFNSTVESLQTFHCPDWFRDAKFGIWSHWGPQSVVGTESDWNARRMYEEGGDDYKDHIKNYGHPSKFGYKDILPLWKAEKWDPDHLMEQFKAAGAHYFVAQAVHHDNFDNWDSKYHKWNSVNMGPHKDMVGLWQQAAEKEGLHFGVSEHLGASFTWFQGSHGADKQGPFAGVPYDGANPAYWDFYHLPAKNGDGGWYSNDPRWIQEWYARMYDLIGRYKPDLLYSDGGLPFKEAGRAIVAQLYNISVQKNGSLQAIYCCKKNYAGTDFYDGTCVEDLERGDMNDIQPFEWQTDTSTGAWFYNKDRGYKSSTEVIHTLMDIVSKNGNLLLNVVQYPDGSLPPEMETFLSEMADWTKINGEAVFGTRPWAVFGEGPTTVKEGHFNESAAFTSRDIRFTCKGDILYATTLGLPKKQVVIHTFASDSPLVTGTLGKVTLLGYDGDLQVQRTTAGLVIQLPDDLQLKSALCFKITGFTAVPDISPQTLQTFKDSQESAFTLDAGTTDIPAAGAQLHGYTIKLQAEGDSDGIGFWSDPNDTASWKLKVTRPGTYQVSLEMGSNDADSHFTIEAGTQKIDCQSVDTGGWYSYKFADVGTIQLNEGVVTLTIRPKSAEAWRAINVRTLRLNSTTP